MQLIVGKELLIYNLEINTQFFPNIRYSMQENEFFDLQRGQKSKIFEPFPIETPEVTENSEFIIQILPHFQRGRINLRSYFGRFLIDFVNWKINKEKLPNLLFYSELLVYLRKWFLELHERYEIFDLGKLWNLDEAIRIFRYRLVLFDMPSKPSLLRLNVRKLKEKYRGKKIEDLFPNHSIIQNPLGKNIILFLA